LRLRILVRLWKARVVVTTSGSEELLAVLNHVCNSLRGGGIIVCSDCGSHNLIMESQVTFSGHWGESRDVQGAFRHCGAPLSCELLSGGFLRLYVLIDCVRHACRKRVAQFKAAFTFGFIRFGAYPIAGAKNFAYIRHFHCGAPSSRGTHMGAVGFVLYGIENALKGADLIYETDLFCCCANFYASIRPVCLYVRFISASACCDCAYECVVVLGNDSVDIGATLIGEWMIGVPSGFLIAAGDVRNFDAIRFVFGAPVVVRVNYADAANHAAGAGYDACGLAGYPVRGTGHHALRDGGDWFSFSGVPDGFCGDIHAGCFASWTVNVEKDFANVWGVCCCAYGGCQFAGVGCAANPIEVARILEHGAVDWDDCYGVTGLVLSVFCGAVWVRGLPCINFGGG